MSESKQKDAELMIQLYSITNRPEMRKAWNWALKLEEQEYEDFIKRNPIGSEGWNNFISIAGLYEMVGILVKYGTINEDMVFDFISTFWNKLGLLVKGFQKERKSPRIFENYEYLAKKKTEWVKTHPAGYKMK